MSSPSYYDDGNFALPLQCGPLRYSFPFSTRGDLRSFVVTMTKRQSAFSFGFGNIILMQQITFPRGATYLVGISDTNDVGNGILEWEETYASVPQTRSEYGSIPYTSQLRASTVRGVEEYSSTKDARYLYQYSINAPLPRVIAPRIVQFDNIFYAFGNWGLFQPGQEVLAQDTESSIYMGRIYERKSILVKWNPYVELT